ncbi:MAG TPA: ABC transporter transmembrane domain-containing protein, partial [Pyrinomonadaceae bacterium]|nr:ABC transporter transmembrane domain-containing protein [Pyrinomonadaceae bacterium]
MIPRREVSPQDESAPRLLSAIKGRERWEVKAIRLNPNLARALEKSLLQYPGVLEVKANPVSGRALVLYAPQTVGIHVESLIREALSDLASRVHHEDVDQTTASPISRVLRLALPDRKKLVGPVLLSIVGHVVGVTLAFCFVAIFNTAAGEGSRVMSALGLVSKRSRTLFMTGVSLLLVGAELLTENLRKKAWRRIAHEAQHNLRTELLTVIQDQDMAFFDSHGTGNLVKLVTEDTNRIRDLVEEAGDQILELAIVIAVYGTVLILTSPGLALLTFLTVPFIVVSSHFWGRKANERYAISGDASSDFTQMLENNLTGIADVKSFTAERRESFRLSSANRLLSQAELSAVSVSAIQSQLNMAFTHTGYFLTMAYGGHLAAAGKITKGQYFMAAVLFPELVASLKDIEQVIASYHGAVNSAEHLAAVLDARPQIRSGSARLPETVRGDVVFENVSFSYGASVKVLNNVSFSLKAGEMLGIVGPTGSGKSTLLNLLLRFYDADSGRILLDGTDIRDLNLQDLRGAVSMVSQDVHLFQGSIRENVVYSHENASEEEILEVLRDAEALDLIDSLPGGLDAEVGERGQRLSGGERQRVAIARALLKLFSGAAILTLDEATSQLDNE